MSYSNISVIFLLTFCLALVSNSVFAGRYVNGVEGIKAASVPGPGLYLRSYNLYYSSGDLKDNNGNNINIGFDITVAASANRLIWVSDYTILGGNYFSDFVVPLVLTDLEFDDPSLGGDETGIGDIYLEPFGIAWHGDRWDSAVAFGIFLDNGDFDASKNVNIGAGYTTYMFTVGGTGYFGADKSVSLSILARYETHDKQDETNIEFGDDFHFEYGLGYTIDNGLDIGLSGYYEKQIDEDKGVGVSSDKDEVFAIGPEIAKAFPEDNFLVSLRALQEFKAENRAEGLIVNLTLTKIF